MYLVYISRPEVLEENRGRLDKKDQVNIDLASSLIRLFVDILIKKGACYVLKKRSRLPVSRVHYYA